MGLLDRYDMSLRLPKADAESRLADAQDRFLLLRLVAGGIYDNSGVLGPPLLVVFEGWDASGKGGSIKRLVAPIDPRHIRVVSFAAPTYDEKRHHFMTRFWPHLPGWGGVTIFDRSWYGRVLVERVEGFASEDQWHRAYAEINALERTLVDEGMAIVKFFMHISHDEQLKRFKERERNPLKRWKLTDEDWRNREKRGEYEDAVVEMLQRTDTSYAPWTVVEGDDKWFARVKVLETVNAALEHALRAHSIVIPTIAES